MHELIKGDIRSYAQSRLIVHSQVTEFRKRDCSTFVSPVNEIVRKAQGVFLWVHLVTQSLLHGLSNDDNLSKLKQRLEQLPDDLDEYYQHVMNGIEAIYRKETAQILRMFLCANEPIPLLGLPPALQTSTYQMVDEEVARSTGWATQLNESIRKQLHARCKDFLQIEPDPVAKCVAEYYHMDVDNVVHCQYRVDFLHLTAKDFLKRPAITQQLMDWDQNIYRPHLLMCERYMFLLKVIPESIFEGYWNIPYDEDGKWRNSPDSDIGDFSSTAVDHIAFHLRQVELSIQESPWALVDDFQKLVNARTQEIKIWPSKTHYNEIRLQDNFRPWALKIGLPIYVEGKLKRNPGCMTESEKGMIF